MKKRLVYSLIALSVAIRLFSQTESAINPAIDSSQLIYIKVDIPPAISGCNNFNRASFEHMVCSEERLHNAIYDNLQYPKYAMQNGKQGSALVHFVVEKDGTLSNIWLLNKIDPDLGQEALRLVKSLQRWLPGQVNGKPVRTKNIISIRFKLQRSGFLKPVFVAPSKIEPNSGNEIVEYPSDEVFKVVEKMPCFPGCGKIDDEMSYRECSEMRMIKFIYSNLEYPASAKEANVEGTVYARILIEKDGSITNPEIMKGIGGGCDEEVLRIIKLMPKWNPGSMRGKTVRVYFNLPVNFKLP